MFIFSTLGAVGVSLPGCQLAAPQQKTLTGVRTASIVVPGTPWAITYASQTDRAFVTLTGLSVDGTTQFGNGSVGVLNTSTFPPSLLHQIPLPEAYQPPGIATTAVAGISQLSLSPDGRRIWVAADQGAIVLDSELAAAGSSNSVLGSMNGTTAIQNPGYQAVAVLITPNDKYAIISQEHGNGSATVVTTTGNLDIFKLDDRTKSGIAGIPIGYLNLGYNVAGTVISPNGRHLYATSERYTVAGVRSSNTEPCSDLLPGFFSVIDLHQLEDDPSTAHHNDIPAGYAPVKVITSSDGKVVWLVSRESNALLAYDAEKLPLEDSSSSKNQSAALLATVQVGSSPVSLAFARDETRILTADSNRFGYAGAVTGLTVIDVQAALEGKGNESVLGRIPMLAFPRDFALSPDGRTMLVTQYSMGRIQAVDIDTLP